MYLSFNHNSKVMKNTKYIEKYVEFDAVTYILTFTKKGNVAYITKKSRFAWKRGVLLGSKISDFGWKGGVFFRPKSAKRGCFSNLGTSVVCTLVGRGGGGGYVNDVLKVIVCSVRYLVSGKNESNNASRLHSTIVVKWTSWITLSE